MRENFISNNLCSINVCRNCLTNAAVPGLNLPFLVADLKLGSVVHNPPYYNLGSESESATPAHIPREVNVFLKLVFWYFLIRLINLGKMFQTKVDFLAIPLKITYRTST